jgi:hypothetical protein
MAKSDPERVSQITAAAIVGWNDEGGRQEMLDMKEGDRIRQMVLVEGKARGRWHGRQDARAIPSP